MSHSAGHFRNTKWRSVLCIQLCTLDRLPLVVLGKPESRLNSNPDISIFIWKEKDSALWLKACRLQHYAPLPHQFPNLLASYARLLQGWVRLKWWKPRGTRLNKQEEIMRTKLWLCFSNSSRECVSRIRSYILSAKSWFQVFLPSKWIPIALFILEPNRPSCDLVFL